MNLDIKHFTIALATAALAAMSIASTSCRNKEKERQQEIVIATTQDELARTLADQDSLLALMNDIQDNLTQLRSLQHIASQPLPPGTEVTDRRMMLRRQINDIQAELEARRQRLAALEERLASSSRDNATLRRSIETLHAQIDQQQSTINALEQSLRDANTRITALQGDIDSLQSTVAVITAQNEETQRDNDELAQRLNDCYFTMGTKDELRAHNIITGGGFLRRTQVLQGDFDTQWFTTADRRTLTSINTASRRAKVLTPQPADTYMIQTAADGTKTVTITNPQRFWETSPYLVIQTD